ncbi:uncharacterized protein BYT42DRAFT_474913, partial [Radiomyces spectabilis]|uniref:uncharacterized protein n=1 Tax=Radiomyces spectabilis TaxID=64574 RepID=UPI00221E3E13
YVFKDNNLPLLLNIIYHLVAARTLLSKPQGAVVRYTVQPHINPAIAASNGRRILPQTSSAIQTIDAYRAIGATHLAFATLAALALKERRIASERLALVVLSVTSMGQTASHAYAYWRSQQQYTLKALQEIGGLDACITVITAIALSNTVSRTGKLL